MGLSIEPCHTFQINERYAFLSTTEFKYLFRYFSNKEYACYSSLQILYSIPKCRFLLRYHLMKDVQSVIVCKIFTQLQQKLGPLILSKFYEMWYFSKRILVLSYVGQSKLMKDMPSFNSRVQIFV